MISYKLSNYEKKIILVLCDIFIIIACLSFSYSLRLEKIYPFWEIDIKVYIVYLLIFFTIFYTNSIYQILIRYFDYYSIKKIIKSIIYFQLILIFINLLIYKVVYFPRSVSFIAPILIGIFVVLARLIICFLINNIQKKDNIFNNIMIIGINDEAVSLLNNLRQNFNYGNVKCFLDVSENFKKREINGIKIYKISNLYHLIDKLQITEIIIASKKFSKKKRDTLYKKLINKNVRIKNVSSLKNKKNIIEKTLEAKPSFFDIINRTKIDVSKSVLEKKIKNKTILVTGGGGSIGSNLCLEILKHYPKKIYILDNSELNLFNIKNKIFSENKMYKNNAKFILGDFGDINFLRAKFKSLIIDEIYHAAAYKHLEFGEENSYSIIKNNIFSTENLLKYVKEKKIKNFTFISSDKAVNPTSMLGITKKIGEMMVKYSMQDKYKESTKFTIVRFGNVIGSSGSVIPIFLKQVSQQKILTVTHKNVERYFMSISEAVQLVINSSYLNEGGFKIFALDMGDQIKIYEIARRIITLSGYTLKNHQNKYGDVQIKITGLKRGEKISEELSLGKNLRPSKNSKILICDDDFEIKNLKRNLNILRNKIENKVVSYKEINKLISS